MFLLHTCVLQMCLIHAHLFTYIQFVYLIPSLYSLPLCSSLSTLGRESRLPLRIKGEGLGPKLQFNFDLLDMGTIFIGSNHSYEVLNLS